MARIERHMIFTINFFTPAQAKLFNMFGPMDYISVLPFTFALTSIATMPLSSHTYSSILAEGLTSSLGLLGLEPLSALYHR